MLISFESISKSFGVNLILDNCTAKIEDNDRIGLIGINGAGKSTLLNVINGDLTHDSGQISRKKLLRLGFLRQDSGLDLDVSIKDEMYSVFSDIIQMGQEIQSLSEKISKTEQSTKKYQELTEQYANLQTVFENNDGYHIDVKISTILNGMGFAQKDKDTIINTLSGGEKTRLALCKLLLQAPELLILDEPTNHLDFKTLMWLEEYLMSYKGALLVVSHDRYFLDKIVTQVWEVERNRLFSYIGNYSKYVCLKGERQEREQKEYEMQQSEIADLKDFIARNMVRASTTGRAKSRQKTLDRMEILKPPIPPAKPAKINFEYKKEPVKDVLTVNNLELKVGDGKLLCSSMDFKVMRGEKIALIGANGVGKSSFLKAIQGLIPYKKGTVEWGRNVEVTYYEQEHTTLHREKTVISEIWDIFPKLYEHTVRSILGAVLLTGENVYKQVGDLSGGERAKLRFAIMMLEEGNFLLLDEPTNHLDLATKEVLDVALTEFPGTVIVVSHDRYLLNRMPTRIVEMYENKMVSYKGHYDDYVNQKNNPSLIQRDIIKEEKIFEENNYFRSKKQRAEEVARKKQFTALESNIEMTENMIKTLEEEIVECGSDHITLAEKCEQLDILKEQLLELVDEWASLEEQ